MRTKKLAAAVVLFMACVAAKAETPMTVLEGHIVKVVGVGAFVLSNSQSRTLVYYRDTAVDQLSLGEQLRVVGAPIDDWMGMGEVELQAQRIERIVGEPTDRIANAP